MAEQAKRLQKPTNLLREEPLEILREEDFVAEREASERRQQEMETADTEPFAVWLEKHA
ncbi:glutamate--cysteine ligase [Escherichia coli]